MKTQSEIDALAAQVRAAGCPDELNRWLGMTPEKLAETETRRAAVTAESRRPDMSKAAQLRAMRENTTTAPAPQAPTGKPKAKKKAAKPAPAPVAPAPAPEPAKPRRSARAPAPATPPAGTAKRSGDKLAIIAKLLKKKNGCTGKEVIEATGWPSVSMPQQAKALKITLHKIKKEGEPMRYADHPIT